MKVVQTDQGPRMLVKMVKVHADVKMLETSLAHMFANDSEIDWGLIAPNDEEAIIEHFNKYRPIDVLKNMCGLIRKHGEDMASVITSIADVSEVHTEFVWMLRNWCKIHFEKMYIE